MSDQKSAGLVLKNYSGFYYVQTPDGSVFECKTRGKLKQQVVSGDRVVFTHIDEKRGILEEIQPRNNLLHRPRIANVTRVLIVMAVDKPAPSLMLLDRLLLLARLHRIQPFIILNKSDLPAHEKAGWILEYYPNTETRVLEVSAIHQQNIDQVRDLLKTQIAVLAGPSGAGKSSLLNALTGDRSMLTQEISERIGRGKHTTRHVQLFPINHDGWIADTPGFSVLDLPELKSTQLTSYYPDFTPWVPACRFSDCLHFRENDCGVKAAVNNGDIPEYRYQNYIHLLEEVIEKERCYR